MEKLSKFWTPWVREEITSEISKYYDLYENTFTENE